MKKHNHKQEHSNELKDDFIDFRVKPTKPRMKNHNEHSIKEQSLKKNSGKTSSFWVKENPMFDCDGSLKEFKYGKSNNLNEKINLLKLELKSILEESKSTENDSSNNNSLDDQELLNTSKVYSPVKFCLTKKSNNDRCETNSEYSTVTQTLTVTSSTPFKDSSNVKDDRWIKSVESKFSQIRKISESLLSDDDDSNKDWKIDKEGIPSTSETPKLKYDMSKLSQHKLEKLIYKSFLLQNLCQQSSSVENEDNAHQGKKLFQKRKFFAKQNGLQKEKRLKNLVKPYSRKRKQSSRTPSSKKVQVINLLQDSAEYVDNSSAEISGLYEPICISSSDEDIFDCIDLENYNDNYSVTSVNNKNPRQSVDNFWKIESNKMGHALEKEKKGLNLSSSQIWECPVCLEPSKGQEIVTTSCGHIFCKECIQNYHAKSSKTCPFCREDLCDKTLIPVCDLN